MYGTDAGCRRGAQKGLWSENIHVASPMCSLLMGYLVLPPRMVAGSKRQCSERQEVETALCLRSGSRNEHIIPSGLFWRIGVYSCPLSINKPVVTKAHPGSRRGTVGRVPLLGWGALWQPCLGNKTCPKATLVSLEAEKENSCVVSLQIKKSL